MAVKIKNSKGFEDEVIREKHLSALESIASTEQLDKLVRLAKNPEMISMLDSLDI